MGLGEVEKMIFRKDTERKEAAIRSRFDGGWAKNRPRREGGGRRTVEARVGGRRRERSLGAIEREEKREREMTKALGCRRQTGGEIKG